MEPQKTPQNQKPADSPVDPQASAEPAGSPPLEEMGESDRAASDQSNPADDSQSPEQDAEAPATTNESAPDASAETEPAGDVPADPAAGPDDKPMPQPDSQSDMPAPSSSFGGSLPESSQSAEPTGGQENSSVPLTGAVVTSPLPVSSSRGQKRGVLFGLIIAAVLLLLSGGAAASYYFVMNKPENVLKQALANAMDQEKTKTVHFNGTVSITEEKSRATIDTTYQGALDNKTGAFDVSGKVDVLVTNVTFDLRSTDSKTFYAKLGSLKGLPELLSASGELGATYAPFISSLDNQWIEINSSLLKQFGGSQQLGTLSQADIQKISDAYTQNPFLVVDKVLADEVVGGESSYHYRLAVDPAKLKEFSKAVKDANISDYKISQDALTQYNQSIDKADFSKYPFEVWISKGSKMLKQASVKLSAEGSSVDIRLTVDSYNQPVKVEKPSGAKSLMEIMGGLLGGGLDLGSTVPSGDSDSGISL